ncbi:MAG: biopolymer transporter ExbB [Candidatus Cloacimonadota bacterium]|nr:MAG: biopolymer transporter ExbB [Candidatus Cloacimonadota bacterium]
MNLWYYVEKGGPIMYFLLFLNIVGYALMIYKFIQFTMIKKRNAKHIFEDIIASIKSRNVPLEDEHVILELIKDEVNSAMFKIEKGLNTIRIISTISPLLGLLGTVLGILSAFTAISKQGLSDPSLFAGGISLALITTVGGLIVAIPHNIGYNYLNRMVDAIEIILEQAVFPTMFKVKDN